MDDFLKKRAKRCDMLQAAFLDTSANSGCKLVEADSFFWKVSAALRGCELKLAHGNPHRQGGRSVVLCGGEQVVTVRRNAP